MAVSCDDGLISSDPNRVPQPPTIPVAENLSFPIKESWLAMVFFLVMVIVDVKSYIFITIKYWCLGFMKSPSYIYIYIWYINNNNNSNNIVIAIIIINNNNNNMYTSYIHIYIVKAQSQETKTIPPNESPGPPPAFTARACNICQQPGCPLGAPNDFTVLSGLNRQKHREFTRKT